MSALSCPHPGCNGTVDADGFCDTCGRRPVTSPPAPSPTRTTLTGRQPSCPSCGATRDPAALFCEACGFDFVQGKPPSTPVARAASTEEVAMHSSPPPTETAASPSSSMPAAPDAGAPAQPWAAAIETDADWYARFCETWKQTHGTECPVDFPGDKRRVERIEGPVVVIGRHAAGIDLALDPNDPAVSHRHASLIRQPDGGYALTDLDSSNGTYVGNEPIAKGQTRALSDGASFTLGAFTRITLTAV